MTEEAKRTAEGNVATRLRLLAETELEAQAQWLQGRVYLLEDENAKLRAALREYMNDCSICGGGGTLMEYDEITDCYLWRDCEACKDARAALETREAGVSQEGDNG